VSIAVSHSTSDQAQGVTACSTQSSQKPEHLRRNAQNMTSLSLVPELVTCNVRRSAAVWHVPYAVWHVPCGMCRVPCGVWHVPCAVATATTAVFR
jgi:hypothetical protein